MSTPIFGSPERFCKVKKEGRLAASDKLDDFEGVGAGEGGGLPGGAADDGAIELDGDAGGVEIEDGEEMGYRTSPRHVVGSAIHDDFYRVCGGGVMQLHCNGSECSESGFDTLFHVSLYW